MSSTRRRLRLALLSLTLLVGLGGAALCAMPVCLLWLVDQRESQTAQQAAPRFGRFVQADDVELFVWEHGPESGEVVLLIPGTSAWSGTWRDLVIDLGEAGYRCVAVDLPPFGYSQRPGAEGYQASDQARRLVALMDALSIEQAALVGHSFGGAATLETALRAPDRTRGLVLLDVALGIGTEPAGPGPLSWILGVRPLREVVVSQTFTNKHFLPFGVRSMIVDPADATEVAVARYAQPLVVEGTTRAVGDWVPQLLAPQTPSVTTQPAIYAQLEMPALVVWGAEDQVTPLSQGQELHGLLPDSQLVVLEAVGHIPQLEDREGTRDAVLAFLQDL